MNKSLALGHAAAFITVVIWGVTFVSTKILLNDFAPLQILYLRFGLGWIALWILWPKLPKFEGFRSELLFAGAGLTGVTLYFLWENIALEYTYASNVGVLVSSAPFFTALFAWKFLNGEKPRAGFFAGFGLALLGIILIAMNGARLRLNPYGDFLAILAAIAWGVYSVLTRKLTHLGYASLPATRRIFFYGLLFMLPFAYFKGPSLNPTCLVNPVNIANLLFLGLGASALCFAIWTFVISRLGAIRASAWIYLVPIVTMVVSAIILNERPTLLSLTGSGLIILGLIFSEKTPRDFRCGFRGLAPRA